MRSLLDHRPPGCSPLSSFQREFLVPVQRDVYGASWQFYSLSLSFTSFHCDIEPSPWPWAMNIISQPLCSATLAGRSVEPGTVGATPWRGWVGPRRRSGARQRYRSQRDSRCTRGFPCFAVWCPSPSVRPATACSAKTPRLNWSNNLRRDSHRARRTSTTAFTSTAVRLSGPRWSSALGPLD